MNNHTPADFRAKLDELNEEVGSESKENFHADPFHFVSGVLVLPDINNDGILMQALMKLRKTTGYSYVNCKKAVDKFGPDNIEEASKWLRELAREQGWAKAAKLSSKQTAEGLIAILNRNNIGAVVELNCQTDFVARGEVFKTLLEIICKAVIAQAETISSTVKVSKGELVRIPVVLDEVKTDKGISIKETITMYVGKLGENITAPNIEMVFGESNISVIGHCHPKEAFGTIEVGKFLSVIGIKRDAVRASSFPTSKLSEQICQHIIGMRPESLGLPPVETDQSLEKDGSNKEEIDENNEFFGGKTTNLDENESQLLRQPFMLNPTQTIHAYLDGHGAQVVNYIRMEVNRLHLKRENIIKKIISGAVPTQGPCVMGTDEGSKNMKCTNEGFFEIVQCNSNYCVCVDPYYGHEAIATKTDPKYTPKCGECFKLYSREASRKANTDLPICDGMTGQYSLIQCLGSSDCYCVDGATGKKNGGTPGLNGFGYNCEKTTKSSVKQSANEIVYPKSILDTQPMKSNDRIAPEHCQLKKDSGFDCPSDEHKKTSGIFYYFDIELSQCLPFFYEGCGGNKNLFVSASACASACIPMDFFTCAGNIKPETDSNNQTITCSSFSKSNLGCSSNFKCIMGPFSMGLCCHKPTQELFEKNYKPTCSSSVSDSAEPVKADKYGFSQPILGKRCSDNFCPSGSVCQQGIIFEKHERFYFDKEWKVCLAMKYSGCGGNNNNFMSRTDCEKCLHHDGSACTGPTESVPLVKTGKDCGSSVCPKSFKCVHNVFYNECCYALDLEFIEEAFSEKCPNGKKSKGIFRDYFQATFGKTCDDLICTDNQTCVQVNKEFAKCCEN
uniref:Elongation factor Ts, mitochondrial n=1 Tax=Rhabditophanes sp. KR3021 TaxID=114890 RepID=A0AC35UI36_9BILA